MCGRYYVDDETEDEIERVFCMITSGRETPSATDKTNITDKNEITGRIGENGKTGKAGITTRDILPTDPAPVIGLTDNGAIIRQLRWGIAGLQKGQPIINARSETVMEKPMFKNGIRNTRLVIPAAGFYEWNRNREKNIFTRQDGKGLFMAGFAVGNGEDERFTILTTAANASVAPVHERMPLILEEREIGAWLSDMEAAEEILHKVPVLLERRTQFEQMSFF